MPVGLVDFVAAVVELADLPEDEAERLALDPRVRLGSEQDEAQEMRLRKVVSIRRSSTT